MARKKLAAAGTENVDELQLGGRRLPLGPTTDRSASFAVRGGDIIILKGPLRPGRPVDF